MSGNDNVFNSIKNKYTLEQKDTYILEKKKSYSH